MQGCRQQALASPGTMCFLVPMSLAVLVTLTIDDQMPAPCCQSEMAIRVCARSCITLRNPVLSLVRFA